MKHTWYECGEAVVVFCGEMGMDGAYRIFPATRDARWEFCPHGTRAWDWYHQAAFNTHRADATRAEAHAALPALPSAWPPPADITVQDPPEPVSGHSKAGSALWTMVERAGGAVPVFVVLEEDPYESSFGDGCFRDFLEASFDEPSAQAAMDESKRKGMRVYLRRGWLRAKGGRLELEIPAHERSPFDHVTAAQVCDALAGKVP